MSNPYDDLLEQYDEAEESHGVTGEPLPTGWYPVRIEKILQQNVSLNQAAQVRLQLQVLEGKQKDKRAFVTQGVGPALLRDGAARPKDDIISAGKSIMGQMKGFLKAIDVQTGVLEGEGPARTFSFYNTKLWEGREFLAKINLRPARGQYDANNVLNAFYHMEDEKNAPEKKGIVWWRKNHADDGQAATASVAAETV